MLGAYNIHSNNVSSGHENGSKDTNNANLQMPADLTTTATPIMAPTNSLPQTITNHPPQTQTQPQPQILGSTPLSQIGCPPLNLVDQYASQLSPCGSSDEEDSDIDDSNNDDLGSNFSNNSGSKRQKRGILPKHATSVMRAWLFQHLVVSIL